MKIRDELDKAAKKAIQEFMCSDLKHYSNALVCDGVCYKIEIKND